MGNDRGPAAGGQLPDRDRRGSNCRPPACAHAADPDWPFYTRHRRHSGTATGPTPRHLAFAVSCVVTTAVWPVLVARRAPAQSWILSVYGCATATVIFAGLSCWLLIAARDGGGDLGMVERLTSAAQSLFPLVVALALRHTARDPGNQGQRGQERSRHCPTVGRQPLLRARPNRWPGRFLAKIRPIPRLNESWCTGPGRLTPLMCGRSCWPRTSPRRPPARPPPPRHHDPGAAR